MTVVNALSVMGSFLCNSTGEGMVANEVTFEFSMAGVVCMAWLFPKGLNSLAFLARACDGMLSSMDNTTSHRDPFPAAHFIKEIGRGVKGARSVSRADASQLYEAMLDAFAQNKPCFMPIDLLAPKLAQQLALRRILGVRNSTHTLVKILQPFDGPALRLVSYTHPEYLAMLTEYFSGPAPAARGDAFLMRGTEGETVANANRAQEINWFHAGQKMLLVERDAPADALAPAPEGRDAAATADWIARALAGEQPVPAPIAAQAAHCAQVARGLRAL
jgi:anthranilate phosphoribosyltransferase